VLLCCVMMCCPPLKTITPAVKWLCLPSDNVTPRHCHDIQCLQQDWDWYIPALPAYSPTFAPYDFLLFPYIKETLRGCRLNLQTPSSLLSQNLHVNRALISTRLQLISCHIGERSAKFFEGIMLSREHVELFSVVQCILNICIWGTNQLLTGNFWNQASISRCSLLKSYIIHTVALFSRPPSGPYWFYWQKFHLCTCCT
jgi:hypothetical protein